MNIPFKINKLIPLFALLLILIGCDSNDDDPLPSAIGGTATVEGGRGTDVIVSVSLRSEVGIQSLSVSANGGAAESLPVEAGTVNQAVDYPFSIPAEATVGTTYPFVFTLVDQDNVSTEFNAEVVVGNLIDAPSTYEFTREDVSTVSFSGQNDRLDQLEEIKAYLKLADAGEAISEQALLDMFANTGDNGGGNFSFTSDRQLKNKTFAPDLDAGLFEDLFARAAAASMANATAENGVAGLIVRENSGNTVLVDENGREFTQFIEKGLMGAVLYNQIYNTYLTTTRLGDGVENVALSDGKNYTAMEHHMDEAFGYWNPPVDFESEWPSERGSEDRFWSHYSNVVDNVRDGELGTNSIIMEAFIAARTAIVNNDRTERDAQVDILYENLDLVAAAVTIHYINDTLGFLAEGNTGEAFHVLSEAWTFANALRYSPRRILSLAEIEEIMESDFGAEGNFWNANAIGLNKAKSTIVTAYPALASVQDDL